MNDLSGFSILACLEHRPKREPMCSNFCRLSICGSNLYWQCYPPPTTLTHMTPLHDPDSNKPYLFIEITTVKPILSVPADLCLQIWFIRVRYLQKNGCHNTWLGQTLNMFVALFCLLMLFITKTLYYLFILVPKNLSDHNKAFS